MPDNTQQSDTLHDTVSGGGGSSSGGVEARTRLNDGEGLEIAEPEDLGVNYDDEGKLSPIQQRIPGTEYAIKVRPILPGSEEKFEDVLDGETDERDEELVDELFQEHIAEGAGSDGYLDEEGDARFPYGHREGLIQAIKNSSGNDIFLAAENQRNEELAGQMEKLEAMGLDLDLEKLMDMVDEDGETNLPTPGENGQQ